MIHIKTNLMKANFIFAIAAIMFSQNVLASPLPGADDLVVEPVELKPMEPVETEVHRVEGQEQVEVHHGRFRVRLNFKDHNGTDGKTRNRGGRA